MSTMNLEDSNEQIELETKRLKRASTDETTGGIASKAPIEIPRSFELTHDERQLFIFLEEVAVAWRREHPESKDLQLRVAGGWVRLLPSLLSSSSSSSSTS